MIVSPICHAFPPRLLHTTISLGVSAVNLYTAYAVLVSPSCHTTEQVPQRLTGRSLVRDGEVVSVPCTPPPRRDACPQNPHSAGSCDRLSDLSRLSGTFADVADATLLTSATRYPTSVTNGQKSRTHVHVVGSDKLVHAACCSALGEKT